MFSHIRGMSNFWNKEHAFVHLPKRVKAKTNTKKQFKLESQGFHLTQTNPPLSVFAFLNTDLQCSTFSSGHEEFIFTHHAQLWCQKDTRMSFFFLFCVALMFFLMLLFWHGDNGVGQRADCWFTFNKSKSHGMTCLINSTTLHKLLCAQNILVTHPQEVNLNSRNLRQERLKYPFVP